MGLRCFNSFFLFFFAIGQILFHFAASMPVQFALGGLHGTSASVSLIWVATPTPEPTGSNSFMMPFMLVHVVIIPNDLLFVKPGDDVL